MRLTLRTLLAYLDDLLEPAQAREIGEKISESGYASALVDRIREVMRRRRLTAPDPRNPNSGLDTNSIAEYLDNTLEPEAVADVEKVCLDSDVHLAEVAASHQILTLVLGEPVDVPARTRERMYALGAGGKPEGSKVHANPNGNAGTEADARALVTSQKADHADSNGDAFATTIPDYLKPVPLWRRMAPVAIGVIVGAFWLSVVYFDPSLPLGTSSNSDDMTQPDQLPRADGLVAAVDDSSVPASNESVAAEAAASGAAGNPESAGDPSINVDGGSTDSSRPAVDIAKLDGFDPAIGTNSTSEPVEPAVPDNTVASTTTPRPVVPSLPEPQLPASGNSVAATKAPLSTGASVSAPSTTPPPLTTPPLTTPPETDSTSVVMPETVVTAKVPAPEVLYTSREGILARQTDEGWMAMPHRTVVRAGDRVASLEPFTAMLEVSSLNLLIELQGGTVIEFLGATSDEQISLQLLSGRISIHRRSAEVDTQPVVAGLHLLDEPCRLTLHSAVALCGVELTAAEPYAYEKELGEDRYIGNLFVVDGRVSFKGEMAGDVSLTAPSWFPLTPVDRRAVAESNDLSPLLIVPEWLDPSGSRVSSTQRRYAARFEKEVDEEQPLHNSIPSIVKSKIPGISEFAVKAMAATGMYNQLVQVMAEAEFLESREAAIAGLRRWLPVATENREILRAALQQYFPADHVDPLYRLLWGYGEDDARNPATSRLLVDWLGHDNKVIRQLAFQHVYRLTGQRYDYRPINPDNQRKVAIDRWYSHLERNSGALLE